METVSVCMEIEQLRGATVRELRTKYFELFGQPSHSNHKQFLFRRIAWRLQALAYGELSEKARQQALGSTAIVVVGDIVKMRERLLAAAPDRKP